MGKEAAVNCPCEAKKAALTQRGEALRSPFDTLFQRLHATSCTCELLEPFTRSTLMFEASEMACLKTRGVLTIISGVNAPAQNHLVESSKR